MTTEAGPGGLPSRDTAVLRQAVRYALAAAEAVTPDLMARPTPCHRWDLRMLLLHASQSLDALAEGISDGRIALRPPISGREQAAEPAMAFRTRARALLAACRSAREARGHCPGPGIVHIAGYPIPSGVLITAGAIEIAVHGWDLAQTCGSQQPVPPALAASLLQAAPLLVGATDRYPLFAPPVPVPAAASPSDKLTAFLGRSPHGSWPQSGLSRRLSGDNSGQR